MLTWTVGDVTITRIVELETSGGTRFLLPQATYDEVKQIPWLFPHFAEESGKLKMSIHALVVETPTRRLIVDTCIGNERKRDVPQWSDLQTTFLDDLKPPASIRPPSTPCSAPPARRPRRLEYHEGGRQVGPDLPQRPLPDRPRRVRALGLGRGLQDRPLDLLLPGQRQAGLGGRAGRPVDTDHRVCDEVTLEPTLGHTPGHVSIRIRSKGEEALITGDFTHHPIQMARPDWAAEVDFDKRASTETRRRVYAALAGTPTLVIGTHFAAPCAGHVVADGEAWKLKV
jgi:hypothetical protein